MSKKRQARNSKRMRKAFESKRSRQAYQTGGVGRANPRLALQNQTEREPLPEKQAAVQAPVQKTQTPVEQKAEAPVMVEQQVTKPAMVAQQSEAPPMMAQEAKPVMIEDTVVASTNPRTNVQNAQQNITVPGVGTWDSSTQSWANVTPVQGDSAFTSSGRTAPIGIEMPPPPTPELPKVEAQQVDQGPSSTTMQMEAVTPAEAVAAKATQAVAAQPVETALAQAPETVEASTMEAATVEQLPEITAAQGQVSPEALVSEPVQATLTEKAVAAQRDTFAEQSAMATAALRPEEKDYVGQVITGTAESMTAKIDTAPINVVAAVADLDPEALVSVQMENLLTGLDEGKVPSWARPALAAVEQQLAERGLSSSTVGRDALFNSIIQSAMPIAQSNAQALQARAAQNLSNQQAANLTQAQLDVQMRIKNLDAENQARQVNANLAQQMGLANLSNAQEKAMMNAQINANFDMKQFDFNQQASLANSQFMQTMTMRDFDARQQAAIQNATAMANLDMANLDVRARAQVQNAQAFLQMDMANLSNEQQAVVLNQQVAQQTLLSNQAAENAARQFNAANQQQADQFMASLGTQVSQYNATQQNAMAQFNASEKNRIEAQNAQNATQVSLANAQMETSINQFNTQLEQQREQFNTANAQAIEQADIAWRRQVNTINTAAQNAANQQNVQNAYGLTMMEQQQLWQQLRDEAAYIRQSYENEQTRLTQLYATAIGNEAAASKGSPTSITALINSVKGLLGGG